jgi:hypothetical protein
VAFLAVRNSRIVAFLLRVSPDRPGDAFNRFPFVSRMNMSVEDLERVAKHLVVDPSQAVVAADRLDSLAEQ